MIDTIKQFACSLAEKELVDKYGKLPEQLMTKGGTYRSKYQDEFNKLYDRYEDRLIRLSGKNVDELSTETFNEKKRETFEKFRKSRYAFYVAGKENKC